MEAVVSCSVWDNQAEEHMKSEYKKKAFFEWTSPLARMETAYIRIPGLELEMIMVCHLIQQYSKTWI